MESELSVRDVLTKEYVGVSESDTVRGAVRLMREERAGCVLVVRGSDPVGIMTEWDVLGLVADGEDPDETTVEAAMSSPVMTIAADRSLTDAADRMSRENIRNLVVEADGEVVGVLTQRDVIAAAGSFQATTAPSRADEASLAGPGGASTSGAATRTSAGEDAEAVPNGGENYSSQGVCEACGSLADSLWESNGQLLCSDCRSV